MKPFRHPIANTLIHDGHAAAGQSGDLYVASAAHGMFSYWRPSLLERLAIAFGGNVRVFVSGERHPPVSLDTSD